MKFVFDKSPVAKTAEAVVTKKSIGTLGGAAIGATLGGSLGIAGKFLGAMVFINGAWVLAPVGGILGYYAAKGFGNPAGTKEGKNHQIIEISDNATIRMNRDKVFKTLLQNVFPFPLRFHFWKWIK